MPIEARLVWLTPLAEADLEDIWAHTFERWSLEQAEHYVGKLALGVGASRAARVERATESCGQRLLALHGRFPRGVLLRNGPRAWT